jgi:two-component system, LytTR family, sensor kinase
VLVDILLAVLYAHFPEDPLVSALAPVFPVSYKNWLMWAVFVPVVLWLVRGVVGSRRPWPQMVAMSFGLAVLLAFAHSAIEMWLHRTDGLHSVLHAGFFSFHFFHGLLTYSVVFAAAAGIESERAGRARERRESRLQNQASEAQLQMLRMQIQPHFLFNTLNSISALVEEDVRGGQKMIGQLSEFLRLTLTHADHQMVPLSEELPLLETYVEIQRARFGDRLRVEYEVTGEARSALVPNLLLQPLVENAIKHGIQPSLAGGTVWVRAHREQEALVLEVADDGVGLRDDWSEGAGIGLRNCRERLRQCFGEGASLEVVGRAPTGTAVIQRLPWATRVLEEVAG